MLTHIESRAYERRDFCNRRTDTRNSYL